MTGTGFERYRCGSTRVSVWRLTQILAGLSLAHVAVAAEVALPATQTDTAPLAAAANITDADQTDRIAWHLQATYVEQQTNRFRAPYAGSNSLPSGQGRETADLTLYLGSRLWSGGELWVNPELDQGFGLGDTTGLAGFSSGEAYKVGSARPYLRWQRAFIRQTWNLAGDLSPVEAAANQFPTSIAADRLVLTAGKFSVGDIFDTNRYAHDPRGDFLNWSAIDTGSFDYAADAWGYTVGAALEWYHGMWTFRAGLFDVSDIPNSPLLEHGTDEYQVVAEVEHRYALGDRQGKIALTSFATHARMALLRDALSNGLANGVPPNPALVRSLRDRYGVAVNIEQELAPSIGAFLRAGTSGGTVETYDFTDIDNSIAAGLSIGGISWGRADDTAGLAGVVNQISPLRRRYFAAGGLGVLTGDGRLPDAGAERIIEAYYSFSIMHGLTLTVDYQRVTNPAYNRERGPVSIAAMRLHAQF